MKGEADPGAGGRHNPVVAAALRGLQGLNESPTN